MTTAPEMDFETPSLFVPESRPALRAKIEALETVAPKIIARLLRMQAADESADGRFNVILEKIQKLNDANAELNGRIGHLDLQLVSRQARPEDNKQREDWIREKARNTAEIQRLQREKAKATPSPLGAILTAIEKATGTLAPVSVAVEVPKGSTAIAEFESVVEAIADQHKARAALFATSQPLEEQIRRAHVDIETRASEGRPDARALRRMIRTGRLDEQGNRSEDSAMTRRFGSIVWPMRREFGGLDFKNVLDSGALLFWVCEDLFKEKIAAELTAKYDPSTAMTTKQRAEDVAAVDAEIKRLSYQAGAFAELAEAAGMTVPFPTKTPLHPLAIIGLDESVSSRALPLSAA